jgi:methanogenic corrinoid protein MtbC1
MKTPGGHRKYKVKDVVEFMDACRFDPADLLVPSDKKLNTIGVSTDYAILTKDFTVLADIFYNTIMEGNREHAFQFLNLLYVNRITTTELYDTIISPALFAVGVKWMKNEIGIEREHLASNTALHAIVQLQDNVARRARTNNVALCGCLEEEYHEIGITCVNNALDSHGWTTYYLGPNLPADSFIDAVENYVPNIICISTTTPKSKKMLLKNLHRIKDSASLINAKLIVGGAGAGESIRKKLPVDFVSQSIAELLGYVDSLHPEPASK